MIPDTPPKQVDPRHILMDGVVTRAAHDLFFVDCRAGALRRTVKARLGGKLRKHRIRLVEGDSVSVAMSGTDLKHGFIVYRYTNY